jgi:hypothetical protein
MKPNTTSAKFTAVVLTCGVAVLGVAAWGSEAPAAGPSRPTPLVLRAVFDAGSSSQVDTGRKGESLGDYVVGAGDLRRAGRPYGRVELVDYEVDNRYEGSLKLGTMFLPRGTLALQGEGVNRRVPGTPAPAEAEEELAIVGGTGAYRAARGTIEIRPSKNGNARLTMHLER